jgi:hypothetical protein
LVASHTDLPQSVVERVVCGVAQPTFVATVLLLALACAFFALAPLLRSGGHDVVKRAQLFAELVECGLVTGERLVSSSDVLCKALPCRVDR